jgi:hypothetical protein
MSHAASGNRFHQEILPLARLYDIEYKAFIKNSPAVAHTANQNPIKNPGTIRPSS